MSEAELLELVSLFGDNAISFFAIYISFTTAYLSLVYIAGRSMSTFQAFAATFLYLVAAIFTGTGCITMAEIWNGLMKSQPTILDSMTLINLPWEALGTIFMSAGVVISLYFMYEVRRGIKRDENAA